MPGWCSEGQSRPVLVDPLTPQGLGGQHWQLRIMRIEPGMELRDPFLGAERIIEGRLPLGFDGPHNHLDLGLDVSDRLVELDRPFILHPASKQSCRLHRHLLYGAILPLPPRKGHCPAAGLTCALTTYDNV